MARLAHLLAVPVAVVLAIGCEKNNPDYCQNHTATFCTPDGPPQPQGCQGDPDCTSDSKATVCNLTNNTCVACGDNGESAKCTEAGAPICDAHTCRACRAHPDCASQACLSDGTCAVEGTIAYVSDTGSTDIANLTCAKATPCKTVQHAVDAGKAYVKIHGKFDEGVTIPRDLKILADPGAELGRTASGSVLQINNTAVVEINDLTLRKSRNGGDHGVVTTGTAAVTLNHVAISEMTGNGISCAGKAMILNRSTISKNAQLGVFCSGGSLQITGSMISKNDGGGVSVSGATHDITNSFIVHNGTEDANVGGVSLLPSGTGNRFEFNTVADNRISNTTTLSGGLFCDGAKVSAANNIIAHNYVAGDPAKVNANLSPGCASATTATGSSLDALAFINSSTEPYDYRLKAGSSAIGAATTTSTVIVDFEGDPRGAAKDQGADQYKP